MNRYPGIQPFERNQSHLFKGREEEKHELLDLITLHPLVVLFAKSGIGKTSLLQAGIAPQMPDEQLLPVFIRLNRTDEAPEVQVRQILQEERYLSRETPTDLSLWEYLKKARFTQAGEACTPVLIFDQFEELFTLYEPEEREQFVAEFADVVNKRMPDSVREWFDRDFDELSPRQVALYERPLNVKVVLSIRSDMLSLLDQLSRPIPSILRCRYELKSLSRTNAEQAIVLPASAEGDFDTPPFTYSDTALDEILNFLQSRDTDTDDVTTTDTRLIESFQLQLLCSHIEQDLPKKDASDNIIIHANDYKHRKGLQDIINDFYHDTIQSFPANRRLNIQKAIEEDLIRNERRISMAASVLKDRNITDSELQDLVNKRLLRKDMRLGGAYYEVSHDTLVKPIVKSYTLRKTEEERKEAQRKLRRAVGVGAVAVLLAVGAFALAGWALQQREIARKAEKLSIEKEIEAQEAVIKYLDAEINTLDNLIKEYTRLTDPKLIERESIKMEEKNKEKVDVVNRINKLKQKLGSNE